MNQLIQDIKFGIRMLTKNPLFTGIAVLTLTLGIGLNATTFSTVKGLLLEPISGVDQPEDLLLLYREWAGIEYGSNSIPHYQDLRDRSGDVFENVASWFFSPVSIASDGRNERQLGMVVSANFFQTYRVEPVLGRPFLPGTEDSGPGNHPVAILGHSFWQSRFGGDEAVLGDTLSINGRPYEIVGVAPESFRGPMAGTDTPLYVPLMMQPEIMPGDNRIEVRGNNNMTVVGRLRPGVTLEAAQAAVDGIVAQLAEEYPDHYDEQLGTTIVRQTEAGLHPSMRTAQVGMATLMTVVVGLLLLIACVNVANLFLARASDRQREMGLRLSLGAGRTRLIRQLLTESVLFSLVAGAASVLVAVFATRLLSSAKPPVDAPFRFDFGVDAKVLLFTGAVALAAGLIFGLFPALQASRTDLTTPMRQGGSVRRSRASRILVITQMALSLVLLVSSGLFLRSLRSAVDIHPGFDEPRSLVMASVDPGLQGYSREQALQFFDRLVDSVGAQPEISAVGLVEALPLGFGNSDRGVSIPGYEFAEGERNSLHYTSVDTGYFDAMGIRMLEGRGFNRTDTEESTPVLVINQRFAERFWPGESALGKIVRTAGEDRQVIGVVETGKYSSLGEDPTEYMYFPLREQFSYGMTLVARTPGDPGQALSAIRREVRALDTELPVFDVRTMQDHLGIALLPARLGGYALGLFGLLGLGLAAVGIYGVMAYSVAQRHRELGIRVALGASRQSVVRQILGEGLRLAIIGSILGLVGAFFAARLVDGLLYQARALDPVTFTAVPALLLLVAAAAVYLPARRASSVDPIRSLRAD